MGLLFGRTEERVVYASDYWGAWASGNDALPGSAEQQALAMVPVFAATRLIADTIASFPLQAYRKVGDARQPVDLPGLFQHPSRVGTTYDWVLRCLSSLTLRGNAFGFISAYDAFGYPSQVEWMNPSDVHLGQDDILIPPVWTIRGVEIDPSRMIHIPNYVLPGRILGVSPIKAYQTVIETGLYAQQFGRDWFRNGSVPSGVVSSPKPMDQDQARTIKERFKNAGSKRDVVTLPDGLTYSPITIPAEESQFIATLNASATQVASIYGLPPEVIGGTSGDSLTYATEEMNEIKLHRRLQPYMSRLEAAWFPLMPRPRYVKFNADAAIRTDLKTRYAAYETSLRNGWDVIDHVRQLEDLPPVPWGAEPYLPGLLSAAAKVAQEAETPPPVAPGGKTP